MVDALQREILAKHCLYQTSWTQDAKCSHVTLTFQTPGIKTPRSVSVDNNVKKKNKYDARIPDPSRSPIDSLLNGSDVSDGNTPTNFANRLVKSEVISNSDQWTQRSSPQHPSVNKKRHKLRPKSFPSLLQPDLSSSSSFEVLHARRVNRANRRKPWTESTGHLLPASKDQDSELFYESYVPEDLEKDTLKKITRRYVTNSKYGNVYELKKDKKSRDIAKTPPLGTWVWEDEMKVWSNDKANSRCSNHSWRSDTDRTTTKTNKNMTPSRKGKDIGKPHADLFAHYHSYRLEKTRKNDAAIMIQKVFRGWYIRSIIKKLKRKAVFEHGASWKKFINEYKHLVIRLQARYGEKKGECGIDLDEIEAFMDQKFKYEKEFDNLAYGAKLMKPDLAKFFNNCDLHPREKELSKAFDSVFKGGGNAAEVVFALDCSSSVGPFGFRYLTTFVKDVVSSFEVDPDHVRVGVIPFNDKVTQAFGLTTHNTKRGVLDAIDEMEAESGITRTDLAIKEMNQMMMAARPGVKRIGIVVTDGRSSHADATKLAAMSAHKDDISMFAIGVGEAVDMEELKNIASSPEQVFSVTSYTSLKTLKERLAKSTCLAAMKGGSIKGKCRPLLKEEAMEILWTLRPPPAAHISDLKKSTWMRPIVNGQQSEDWAVLDDDEMEATDIKTCLRVVIQAKLEREGFMYLPSKERYGVEKVTNPDEAIKVVNEWMKQRQDNKIDMSDKHDPLSHWMKFK